MPHSASENLGKVLFWAAQNGNQTLIKRLLQSGVDLLKKHHIGKTAFQVLPKTLEKEIALFKIKLDYKVSKTLSDNLLDLFLMQLRDQPQKNQKTMWSDIYSFFFVNTHDRADEEYNARLKTKWFLMNSLSPKLTQENETITKFTQLADCFATLPIEIFDIIIAAAAQDLAKEIYNTDIVMSDMRQLRSLLPSYFKASLASREYSEGECESLSMTHRG